jgi:disulfide bond formation protein DsbB
VIGFVLFAQYVQGFQPCELCLRERWPWYAVIAVAAAGLAFPSRGMLALIGLLFTTGAGLGLHHVGVEQGWWAGPSACTGGTSGARSVDELRAMLESAPMVRCDEIVWRLFGLSMATYDFLLCLAGGVSIALWLALGNRRNRHAR